MNVQGLQFTGRRDHIQELIHAGGLEHLIHPVMDVDDLQLIRIRQSLLQHQKLTQTGCGHMLHVGEIKQNIAVGIEVVLSYMCVQDMAGAGIDTALNIETDLAVFSIFFNEDFHTLSLSCIG